MKIAKIRSLENECMSRPAMKAKGETVKSSSRDDAKQGGAPIVRVGYSTLAIDTVSIAGAPLREFVNVCFDFYDVGSLTFEMIETSLRPLFESGKGVRKIVAVIADS